MSDFKIIESDMDNCIKFYEVFTDEDGLSGCGVRSCGRRIEGVGLHLGGRLVNFEHDSFQPETLRAHNAQRDSDC